MVETIDSAKLATAVNATWERLKRTERLRVLAQVNTSAEDSKWAINSLRPRLNRCHFADNIFKCIFLNENEWILSRISLKFVPKVRINNIPALVQIMAWRRPGDKPLSEPMIVSLLTHICVTRPQWVNRDHFVYAPSQWETTLQCNVVSHWLGAFRKWTLYSGCSDLLAQDMLVQGSFWVWAQAVPIRGTVTM